MNRHPRMIKQDSWESARIFDGIACGTDNSAFFCGAGTENFLEEPEFINDYERTIDILTDIPKDLDRPLAWKLILAHRGGNWGDAPVPTRCEVCQMNFSSHTLLENHYKSPRHARNARYATAHTPASASHMLLNHATSPRAVKKRRKRSGSLAPPKPAQTPTPQAPNWEEADAYTERHTCISKVEVHTQPRYNNFHNTPTINEDYTDEKEHTSRKATTNSK